MNIDKIIVDGVSYLSTDKGLIKDNLTGKWLHKNTSKYSTFYGDLLVYNASWTTRPKFDPKRGETWMPYRIETGYTDRKFLESIIGEDGCVFDEYTLKLSFATWGPRSIEHITCTPERKQEIIKLYDLVPGINNPDVYFDKLELEYMDKPKPYRKFDNTFKELSTRDVLGKIPTVQESSTPEVREIFNNVLKRNIQMGVKSLVFKETENLKYTYGLELETCSGRLEDDEVIDLNVKAVHDGSLREADGSNPIGGEYVTGILVGDAGLAQLHELCRVLQTKCKVDKRCGVHVHVGSLNWTKEEIVYSYILGELIEEELFSILPPSRRNNSYCRPINKLSAGNMKELYNAKSSTDYEIAIDSMYNIIMAEVSGLPLSVVTSKRINRNQNHPKGSKCGYDKASQRYCWLNYVTLLFDTKGAPGSHTLEFRPMSATLNYTKIKNWLKICMAFCAFVENYKPLIKQGWEKGLKLETIISKIYPNTGAKLNAYINERKQIFKTADESVDYAVDSKIAKKSLKEVSCAL